MNSSPLMLVGETGMRTYYDFARLQSLSQWWHWLLLVIVSFAVVAYVAVSYIREGRELPKGLAFALLVLRLLTFACILVTYLGLERRSERRLVDDSRVLMLVDTSQSMALRDDESTESSTSPLRRIDHVIQTLGKSNLVPDLRRQHEVVIYRFDQNSAPTQVATFRKLRPILETKSITPRPASMFSSALTEARLSIAISGALLAISVVFGAAYIFRRSSHGHLSWFSLLSVLFLFTALFLTALTNLRHPEIGPSALLGASHESTEKAKPDVPSSLQGLSEEGADADEPEWNELEWDELLAPHGAETRLGDALKSVLEMEQGTPMAGIVVLSDGNSNAGLKPSVATAMARAAEIPIHTIGLGSDQRPVNVRVADLQAPSRAYPGDAFTITAFIQTHGVDRRQLRLRLESYAEGQSTDGTAAHLEQERRIQSNSDDELMPVRFEVTPHEKGRRVYRLSVSAPEEDQNLQDNQKTATVRVVQRNNRVLLFAGGPTREFRYLRNQLFRDEYTVVDVLLQTAQPGVSQEADEILFEFPNLADELFDYDTIVAFDPDWTKLDAHQIELIDRWIADKAGGLVVLAGPVFTPMWSGLQITDSRIDMIKDFYPVVFYRAGTASLQLGQYGSETAWPLAMTDEGLAAPFLRMDGNAKVSESVWANFSGVYGYFAVKGAKPGAKVYCRFSNPQAAIGNASPVYMAGHFYGAGRVFYLASGEMWRLRTLEESYFEQFYTKLIRHVSEGRLLRDSNRGSLMVDNERCRVGDTVNVRASLTDLQHRPLTDTEVTGALVSPDGTSRPLTLGKIEDASRDGMYWTQFTAINEGDYRIELVIPQGGEGEALVRDVHVRLPDLEIENPRRNDSLLREIAQDTSGVYYVGMAAAVTANGPPPLTSTLVAQDDVTYLAGTPDMDFERRLMGWLLVGIAGALCLEWLIRRLNKLA